MEGKPPEAASPPMDGPSRPLRPLVDRPRLLEILRGRFTRRLTLIVAGAGFGKTTLLRQALERNAIDRYGVDLWLPFRPAYQFLTPFSEALREVSGARNSHRDPVEDVADAIWQRAPAEVALVLDDVHILRDGPEATDLLGRLLQALPTNGHLVLAGRSEPPLRVSRLLAQGQAALISEEDLAFDAGEQQKFAAQRRVDPAAVRDIGGWPAVLELCASVGKARVADFLWDEVLAGLGEERCRALARLSALESFDDELVREVTGLDIPAQALISELPLTSVSPSGEARLHPLWRPVIARFKESRDAQALRRASRVLCKRGDLLAAVDLCMGAEDPGVLTETLDEIARSQALSIPGDMLEALVLRLPKELLEEPAGQLIQGAHCLARDPKRADVFLVRAAEGYAERKETEGVLQALSGRLNYAFWKASLDEIRAVTQQVESLAGSEEELPALASIGRAYEALVGGQPDQAAAHIERARLQPMGRAIASIVDLVSALAALDQGHAERALQEARDLVPRADRRLRGTALVSMFEASWLLGRVSPGVLDRAAKQLPDQTHGVRQNAAQFYANFALMSAIFGRLDSAREHLAQARSFRTRAIGPRPGVSIGVAQMAIHCLEGDEAAAVRCAEAILAEYPLPEFHGRHYLRGLPLLYLFSKPARVHFDALKLGPCFETARAVGRALLALREENSTVEAAALDWSKPNELGALLVPPLQNELAVAAVAGGADAARAALEGASPDPRPLLRRLRDQPSNALAATAKQLLTSLPVPPDYKISVRVLGPLELLRDGKALAHPDWRRERVRALLQFLVAHPRTTRGEVGAALWPELDEESVSNNLRVTLRYLQRVLEPGRGQGEPAWFVRVDGDLLALTEGEKIDVDAQRFERHCDGGDRADASGDPATAMSRYLEALSLYRGDYLADAADPAWGEADQTRLRSRFVKTAVRAGELLLAKGDTERSAQFASRAAQIEPFAEAAHRLHALAYQARGDRAAARRALEAGLRELSEAELEPEGETLRLAQQLGLRTRSL